jgi:hypothetical protein
MDAKTAELAGNITKPNRDQLADLTKLMVDVVKKQTVEEAQALSGEKACRPFVIRPLTSPNEIQMSLFDQTDSFFSILSHPPLFECEGHACGLYSDCVRDALGKGYDLDFVPKPSCDINSQPDECLFTTHRPPNNARCYPTYKPTGLAIFPLILLIYG